MILDHFLTFSGSDQKLDRIQVLSQQIKNGAKKKSTYHKVASSNTPHFEAHPGYFRLLMKGKFDPF